MYKVLLVDDERWVLESLKLIVPWNENGFEIIGQAMNGTQAHQKIIELNPDVIVVDIQMPGMDGLELIKKIKKFNTYVQFIVVSGYAEFEYAKEAMKYGVVGYCLKPVDIDEMVELLNKIKINFNNKRKYIETNLFYLIESGSINNEDKIKNSLKDLGLVWNKTRGLFIIIIIGEIMELPVKNYIKIKIGNQKFLYIVDAVKLTEIENYLYDNVTNKIKGIGISSTIKQIKDIERAVEEANLSSYQFFINGVKVTFYSKISTSNKLEKTLESLGESIKKKDVFAIEKIINNLSNQFENQPYNIKHVFRVYNRIMSFICSNVDEQEEEYIYDFSELIKLFKNFKHMISYLRQLIIDSLATNDLTNIDNVKNETFKKILKYINENYYKNITMQNIAKKYYITPSYISHLFRKENKGTFTKYLTDIRLLHACNLLKDEKLLINDIAEKVGYQDYFYFARVFKKNIGKTPMQYRNNE